MRLTGKVSSKKDMRKFITISIIANAIHGIKSHLDFYFVK
jgi:hypothetical protein